MGYSSAEQSGLPIKKLNYITALAYIIVDWSGMA